MAGNITVRLSGGRDYTIFTDTFAPLAGRLAELTAGRHVMTVADTHTAQYAARFGLTDPVVIPAGEASKTFANAAMLCGEAVRRGLNRKSVIAALGGGVVGDLAGFAGAIFMRGIDVIQIPTSLLAMVDSSVGGKTAVDLPEGKNLAGAFHQPCGVLIAPECLQTLPARERIGALAEVVKYGAALDAEFFAFLEQNAEKLTAHELDAALYEKIIRRSCEIKAEIVAADETESGIRAYLNYGHTIGHAVELLSNFRLSHGESVAIGMAAAGRLAAETGSWSRADEARQRTLLRKLGLPTAVPAEIPAEKILNVMGHDKKNTGNGWNLILPVRIGEVRTVRFTEPQKITDILQVCR